MTLGAARTRALSWVLWPFVCSPYGPFSCANSCIGRRGLGYRELPGPTRSEPRQHRLGVYTSLRYWTPLDVLSHMTDCHLFGLNPAGHHAVNLFIHTASVVLLFVLLRWTTGRRWCSALVAALFCDPSAERGTGGVGHRPQRRPEHVSGPIISADLFPVHRKGRRRRYALALVFFVMSLMVKPAFVPFPCYCCSSTTGP